MINWIRIFGSRSISILTTAGLLALTSFGQDNANAPQTANEDDPVRILWRGEPLVSVLHHLETLTGRSVIRPMALPTPEFTFDSRGDMTLGEAVLAIESLLSINGIGVTPLGEKFLKVVAINTIRTEAPELEIDSLQDRAPSGKVVSKLFRLQYLDSQTFQSQIQPFLSPNFSTIIPFQNSNAVIVTDTISNLQRLEYVVSEVDKPSRLNVTTQFYTLQFAQASEVAEQIQGLIDAARANFGTEDNSSNNNRGQVRGQRGEGDQVARFTPTANVGGEGAIPNQILFGSNTAIAADDRTNQLIIMSEPANMTFFDEIIEKLDIKSDPATRIEVIVLNHAEATEVAGLLSSFVSGSTDSESNDRSQANANASNRQTRQGNPQSINQNSRPQQQVASPALQQQVNSAVNSTFENRDSQFSEFMTIEADERSNALIISGTRSDLELMTELVAKIDVLLPQVRIEVIIAEVNLDNDANSGMESISGTYTQNEADGEPNITNLQGLDLLGISSNNVSFNLDSRTGVITNLTFDTILNAARTNSNVRILSIPTLLTTHNQEATFTVGQQRPIVTGTTTDNTLSTSVRETVQYQDIAIELKVKPLIGPNDVIQLEVDQSVNDIDGFVTINNNEQPIIGRRQMVSFVSVENNGLVVLGGMQRSKETKNVNRVAVLGEIPVLGNIFRSRGVDFEKRELLVFIRPKVIRDSKDANEDAMEKMNVHPIQPQIDDYIEEGSFSLSKKAERDGHSGNSEKRDKDAVVRKP
ncbi:MAG: secretin N-terminal domain-containing protein [Verrucomicrobiota bacterium]|nr:secretin N-terminal domain-containing protein [Verrucomicrobiota bacterium]